MAVDEIPSADTVKERMKSLNLPTTVEQNQQKEKEFTAALDYNASLKRYASALRGYAVIPKPKGVFTPRCPLCGAGVSRRKFYDTQTEVWHDGDWGYAHTTWYVDTNRLYICNCGYAYVEDAGCWRFSDSCHTHLEAISQFEKAIVAEYRRVNGGKT